MSVRTVRIMLTHAPYEYVHAYQNSFMIYGHRFLIYKQLRSKIYNSFRLVNIGLNVSLTVWTYIKFMYKLHISVGTVILMLTHAQYECAHVYQNSTWFMVTGSTNICNLEVKFIIHSDLWILAEMCC